MLSNVYYVPLHHREQHNNNNKSLQECYIYVKKTI
jgi:hypothetical protein